MREQPACPTLCCVCASVGQLQSCQACAEELSRASLAAGSHAASLPSTQEASTWRSRRRRCARGRRSPIDRHRKKAGETHAYVAPTRSARAAQADIQMMLAAQCHLGTKCVPEACQLQTLSLGLKPPARCRCFPKRRHAPLPVARGVLSGASPATGTATFRWSATCGAAALMVRAQGSVLCRSCA